MKTNKRKQIELISITTVIFLLVIIVIITPSNSNTLPANQEIAETSSTEVIYIIGNHIFTEKNPYISSKMIMYAAQTIELPEGIEGQSALDYMHIYLRDLEGNWIDATTGEIVNYDDLTINIKYKDLERYYVKKANVSNLEELEKALADEHITTITLTNDLEITTSLTISKKVRINGNNNTIRYTGENQEPVIIANSEDLTLSNMNITGGIVGVLNSGNLILDGTINLSGNTQNGIKVENGYLKSDTAILIYDEEDFLKPALISTNNAEIKTNLNDINNITEVESHFYINKDLLKSEWTQIGATITKGNIGMTVGDKINYKVDGYDGNWLVFGVDNNKVILISEGYVNESFELDGTPDNFEEISINALNAECSQYANGKHSILARSVKIEDIDRITGYDPIKMEYGKDTHYAYNNQMTYTIYGVQQTQISTYYSYMGEESVNIKKGSKAYATIFGQDYTADYWIATAFVRTFEQYFNRGIRVLAEDEVQRSYLKIWGAGWNNMKDKHGIRAIVELNNNITISRIDEDNYIIEE